MARTRISMEVERRMRALGLTSKGLSRKAGLGETFVRDLLEGRTASPRAESLEKLARALGCALSDLLSEAHHIPSEDVLSSDYEQTFKPGSLRETPARFIAASGGQSQEPSLTIDELDISAGNSLAGLLHEREGDDRHEAVIGRWQMPKEMIRAQTPSPAEQIKIIRAKGDSNQPVINPGDRVMIDTQDRIPSPPGFFAIWDGTGQVIKRLEIVPYSDPVVVRLISANPAYEPREYLLDTIVINGRMIGKWLWT